MAPAGWSGQAVQMERVELLLPRTVFSHLRVWRLNPFWWALPITHLLNSENLRSSVFSPCWLTSCQVFRKRPKSWMYRKRQMYLFLWFFCWCSGSWSASVCMGNPSCCVQLWAGEQLLLCISEPVLLCCELLCNLRASAVLHLQSEQWPLNLMTVLPSVWMCVKQCF